MSISFATLKRPHTYRRVKRRVGRGDSSGRGSYSGRGIKGQRARSGGSKGLKIMALRRAIQQIPKLRGFKSHAAKSVVVNVGALADAFSHGATITPALLNERGLARGRHIKILGDGAITFPIIVKGVAVSASAKTKIEQAGGTVSN